MEPVPLAGDSSADGEITISSTYVRACVAAGDMVSAARLYDEAAQAASNLAERHHLSVQAARLSKVLRGSE